MGPDFRKQANQPVSGKAEFIMRVNYEIGITALNFPGRIQAGGCVPMDRKGTAERIFFLRKTASQFL